MPLALINLEKNIEPNWDLTMAKVAGHAVQYNIILAHIFPLCHRSVNI